MISFSRSLQIGETGLNDTPERIKPGINIIESVFQDLNLLTRYKKDATLRFNPSCTSQLFYLQIRDSGQNYLFPGRDDLPFAVNHGYRYLTEL